MLWIVQEGGSVLLTAGESDIGAESLCRTII
jgi:hypothetical protein